MLAALTSTLRRDRGRVRSWELTADPDTGLTSRVEPILDKMTQAASLTREAALADFDTDERQQLCRMLQRVKANLAVDDPLATAAAPPATGRRTGSR